MVAITGGGGSPIDLPRDPIDRVVDDPRNDPNMPVISKNGAIAFGMLTLWRQVRMGTNPPADGETCQALREELLKHGFKPKTKATKQELVLWVKTTWRVWRKYLLWQRLQFKNDPRKLEMDDQLRIAQSGAPSFAMSLSLREEMRRMMASAKTDQERDNISHNYRAAGDPFYNYFPPRLEPPEGSKKVIEPFKAGKQVMLGDLVREGKVEHRAKFARHRAEDLAAARKAERATAARNSVSAPNPATVPGEDFSRRGQFEDISNGGTAPAPAPSPSPAITTAPGKYDAVPLSGNGHLYVPPAVARPFKRPINLAKKKRSPLRKSPSPGKVEATNIVVDPTDVPKTPEQAANPSEASPKKTPTLIDLEPEIPSATSEGGFIAEVPRSEPYFDLTGDDERIAPFRDWTSPSSQWEFEGGHTQFFTTTRPKRSID